MAKKYTTLVDDEGLIEKYSVKPFRMLVNSRCDRYVDTNNKRITCDDEPANWGENVKYYHTHGFISLGFPEGESDIRFFDFDEEEELIICIPEIVCNCVGLLVKIEKRFNNFLIFSKSKSTKKVSFRVSCFSNISNSGLRDSEKVISLFKMYRDDIINFAGYSNDRYNEFLKAFKHDWTVNEDARLSIMFLNGKKGSLFYRFDEFQPYYKFLSYFRHYFHDENEYAELSKEDFFKEVFRIPKNFIEIFKNHSIFFGKNTSSYYIRDISTYDLLRIENYPESLQNILKYYCNGTLTLKDMSTFLTKYDSNYFKTDEMIEAFRRFLIRIYPLVGNVSDFYDICELLKEEDMEIKPENISLRLLSALKNKKRFSNYLKIESLMESNDYLEALSYENHF